MPRQNASDDEIRQILHSAKTIAVVGLSDKPDRPSYRVAAYLKAHGYRIIPINPNLQTVLGEQVYEDLRRAPGSIDIVDVFRKPEAVPEIVELAIARKARAVWMQEGIVHNVAADRARAAGLQVVMNKCIMKEHWKLPGNPAGGNRH